MRVFSSLTKVLIRSLTQIRSDIGALCFSANNVELQLWEKKTEEPHWSLTTRMVVREGAAAVFAVVKAARWCGGRR
ncbi:hypothetical protein TSUD_336280 [Trifolium subterraneum]|uniref:Uncharacterized protein n=1 Tax=Trifolium subterraneum TaxID=3900 RepID=A0A2Z6LS91_TRISU|nr:hypothetical protein TSUD_336280 [Trifolium subterraneum]